jgi:chromosomal replication initiator protein
MDQYALEDREDVVRLRGAWHHVLRRIAPELPKTWMDRFIGRLQPNELRDGVAVLTVPGQFVQEWVNSRYLNKLEELLSDELGEEIKIELKTEGHERAAVTLPNVAPSAMPRIETPSFAPIDRYTFDSFVVGQSNRLAFAGAKSVADDPGKKYNPLFIYGPSGLGKTHLLHSIASSILARDPSFKLVYISAQQFAEDFVNALQNGRIEQFRRQNRNVEVWLVDDIQFVAGKDKTMEEVFHTFNHLQSMGKQIVLSSDRPPRDLYLMNERLRSRFEAGLVADIQPPDTETRCAILLSKAEQEDIALETSVAMYLAENVPGNIRILEGALTKLAVQASVSGMPICQDLAAELVEKYYRTGSLAKPSFSQIVESVSKHYRIKVEDVMGTSRKAPIVHARHVSVYVIRELTGDSWKHIGTMFGDRDHTSMMHAYQKVSVMIAQDPNFKATVKMLMRNLHPEA